MSEEDKSVASEQTQENSVSDFVSKKAYEEVTTDMHKFKASLKSEKAKAAEYEAQLKALEEDRMRENNQWKELAEKYKSDADNARTEQLKAKEDYLNTVKRQALKDELGLSNDKYLVHADINSIEVNEFGIVDKDSLLDTANVFREEHSILLSNPAGSNATSRAASPGVIEQKSLADMTIEERQILLKTMKTKI